MPRPRPPSRIEPLHIPAFAIHWLADPGDGTSIIAYCGGGGSARTGVNNAVMVEMHLGQHALERAYMAESKGNELYMPDPIRHMKISTGSEVGVALKLYQLQTNGEFYMMVAMGSQVNRYHLPSGVLEGALFVMEPVNAIAVSAMGDQVAVGCDSGLIKVYEVNDEDWILPPPDKEISADDQLEPEPIYVYKHHNKTVCSMDFSVQGGRLISSAKDGTALIWENGSLIAGFQCSVRELNEPPPTRPMQVLVRGCAFCDLYGKSAVVVASGRKGKAFLSRWEEQLVEPPPPEEGGGDPNNEPPRGPQVAFACTERINCSPHPISAMSLSSDGFLLALGATDGTITLWDMSGPWNKPLISWKEVHELPVTCIAARPFAVPLLGEDIEGVDVHARSASADSQLACLTMQKKANVTKPSKNTSSSGLIGISFFGLITGFNRILYTLILAYLLSPVYKEAQMKCGSHALATPDWKTCIVEEFLIAPPSRTIVYSAPY